MVETPPKTSVGPETGPAVAEEGVPATVDDVSDDDGGCII